MSLAFLQLDADVATSPWGSGAWRAARHPVQVFSEEVPARWLADRPAAKDHAQKVPGGNAQSLPVVLGLRDAIIYNS